MSLLERIGEGGMGAVYRAVRRDDGEIVAIKFMHHDLTSDPDAAARFLREAELMDDVQHPGVMRLFSRIHTPDTLALVMPYIEDGTLADKILTWREEAIELDVDAIHIRLQLMHDILDAVCALHAHDIIHRDIKPANVLLDGRGRPILCDLGIATLNEDILARLTRTARGAGTHLYMAPEQHKGKPASVASDIYACGLVLFELLSGQFAYVVEDAEVSYGVSSAHIRQEPAYFLLPLATPRHVRAALTKSLAKDPTQRFTSARDFQQALARPQHPVAIPKLAPRRVIHPLMSLGTLVAIAALGLFGWWMYSLPGEPLNETAQWFADSALKQLANVSFYDRSDLGTVAVARLIASLSVPVLILGLVLFFRNVRILRQDSVVHEARELSVRTNVRRGATISSIALLVLCITTSTFFITGSSAQYVVEEGIDSATTAIERQRLDVALEDLERAHNHCHSGLSMQGRECAPLAEALSYTAMALAAEYREEGRIEEHAELVSLARRVLEQRDGIRESIDEASQRWVATSDYVLAEHYMKQGRYEDARRLYDALYEPVQVIVALEHMQRWEDICDMGSAELEPTRTVKACRRVRRFEDALFVAQQLSNPETLDGLLDDLVEEKKWGLVCQMSAHIDDVDLIVRACRSAGDHVTLLEELTDREEVEHFEELAEELFSKGRYGIVCSLGSATNAPELTLKACEEIGAFRQRAQLLSDLGDQTRLSALFSKLAKEEAHDRICSMGSEFVEPARTARACEEAGRYARAFKLHSDRGSESSASRTLQKMASSGDVGGACALGSAFAAPSATARACESDGQSKRAIQIYYDAGKVAEARRSFKRAYKRGEYELVCDLGGSEFEPRTTALACEQAGEHSRSIVIFSELGLKADAGRTCEHMAEEVPDEVICALEDRGIELECVARACEEDGQWSRAVRLYESMRKPGLVGGVYSRLAESTGSLSHHLMAARSFTRARNSSNAQRAYERARPVAERHRAVRQYLEIMRASKRLGEGLETVISWMDDAAEREEHHVMGNLMQRMFSTLEELGSERRFNRAEARQLDAAISKLEVRIERVKHILATYPEIELKAANVSSESATGYSSTFLHVNVEGAIKNTTGHDIESIVLVLEFFEPELGPTSNPTGGGAGNGELPTIPEPGYIHELELGRIEATGIIEIDENIDTPSSYKSFHHYFKRMRRAPPTSD